MRTLVFAAVCLVALAVADFVAADGRYRRAAWQEASRHMEGFNAEVRHFVNKSGL